MKSVCVFCGSSGKAGHQYLTAARELGALLAKRDLTLIYGGAKVGLMGELADAALAEGGRVIGVMPRNLVAREIVHEGLSQLVVAESMHERKMKMASLAGAFVALPGGLGTLEEIFEAMTWTQLRLHEKACGFLNVDGYFDYLLEFIGHTVREGFVRPEHRAMLVVGTDPATLLDRLALAETPQVDKLM